MNAKLKETLLNPIFKGNPVTVLILGICSSLAVTVQLKGAFVMGLSVMIVTGLSSFVVSMMRNSIPNRVRIIIQLVVVSLMVILVDQFLKAYSYSIETQLSVYVGLIITNCIVMGRIEAFGLCNKPLPSLIDGLANGAGYALILIVLAFFRELLGSGTLFGADHPRELLRRRLRQQRSCYPPSDGADSHRLHRVDPEEHPEGPSGKITSDTQELWNILAYS